MKRYPLEPIQSVDKPIAWEFYKEYFPDNFEEGKSFSELHYICDKIISNTKDNENKRI
jgi:hypothetical protein